MKLFIFQVINGVSHITSILERLSPLNKSGNTNVTRAVLAYLPPNMDNYVKEFRALYLSIAVMRTTQPENIKTDFIIFTPKEAIGVPLSIGCVNKLRLICLQALKLLNKIIKQV
jgi:hypothetical protein